MSISSDTCELFDDEDDVRCDAVNAMLHDIVGGDTNNYAQDDTYDDTQNDTYDNTYDGTQPADRADAYRSFLSRIFSDAGTRYAFEMWLGDATARALPTDDIDECLTACSVCDENAMLTMTLFGMFPNYLNGFSWTGYASELMQPADGQLEKSDIMSLTLDGLRHSDAMYDLIVADATTLRYGEYDCMAGEEPSPDDYMPLVEECLHHSKFCVAMLPEAFVRNGASHARCSDVILPMRQVSPDVPFPVCIALISPYETDDVKIWNGLDAMRTDVVRTLNVARRHSDELTGGSTDGIIRDDIGDIGFFPIGNADGDAPRTPRFGLLPRRSVELGDDRQIVRFARADGVSITSDDIDRANDLLREWLFWFDGMMATPVDGLRDDGLYRRRVPDEYAMRILAKVVFETA